MLASKISRAAHRVCPPLASVQCTHLAGNTPRGKHQRRRSSSKASCPPDSNSKSAPAAKVAATTTTPVDEAASPALRAKRANKHRRLEGRLTKPKRTEQVFEYSSLPAVPGVEHLGPKDISFSSFFSLHRPLSLTNPIPPSVSQETFNSIFETKTLEDPWANGNSAEGRPEDVVYALSREIESLETAIGSQQNEVVHIDVLTDASNEEPTRHIDSLPRRIATLEETVAQYQPFKAPPPPQPFIDIPKPEKKRAARQNRQAAARTKSYTTTIVVTESTFPDGETRYAASASPIVRLPDPVSEADTAPTASIEDRSWMPYRKRIVPAAGLIAQLHRLKIREPTLRSRVRRHIRRPAMLLISVKRQRKLKMKKHKYKKLMKRTRNLRRRLENK